MGALSPTLSVLPAKLGLEAAEGGSSLTSGFEVSTGALPGFESLQPAEPEIVDFSWPICSPSGVSWKVTKNTLIQKKDKLILKMVKTQHLAKNYGHNLHTIYIKAFTCNIVEG